MHGIVKFLIVLLRFFFSLCLCTILLSEVNTVQTMHKFVGEFVGQLFFFIVKYFPQETDSSIWQITDLSEYLSDKCSVRYSWAYYVKPNGKN